MSDDDGNKELKPVVCEDPEKCQGCPGCLDDMDFSRDEGLEEIEGDDEEEETDTDEQEYDEDDESITIKACLIKVDTPILTIEVNSPNQSATEVMAEIPGLAEKVLEALAKRKFMYQSLMNSNHVNAYQ